MEYYIITGASRGLGEAIAKQLLHEGKHCICLSRSKNQSLDQVAASSPGKLHYIQIDMENLSDVQSTFDELLSNLPNASSIFLINNAGVIEPIKPTGQQDIIAVEKNMKVNYLSPVLTMNLFLSHFSESNIRKVVVNVSSGAALNPLHGWLAYCSSKSALEMATRVAALEQKNLEYPTTFISFSPGVMDTEMQATIRSSDENDFAEIKRFKELKEKGQLRTATVVAEKLIQLLKQEELENGKFYDIKHLI